MNEMHLDYDDFCPENNMVYMWHSLYKQEEAPGRR